MDDQFSTLRAEVKAAFEAYLTANGSVRERAKTHGEALIRLRTECADRELDFVATLKELGVVVSTAYHHIKLALSWEQAEDMARMLGVEFEAMTITEVIESVKSPKKEKPNGGSSALDPATTGGALSSADTDEATDGVFAQVNPPAAPPIPAPVQKLIDQKLIQAIHAVKGRTVRVKVGDTPVLVVPR